MSKKDLKELKLQLNGKPDKMKNVLLCSGGRTSGLMLRRQLDTIADYRREV